MKDSKLSLGMISSFARIPGAKDIKLLTFHLLNIDRWDPVTGLGTPNYPKMLDLFMSLP